MVWELPRTQANVCGGVKVVPSTTIEPDGLAVNVIDTVGGDEVVLVELLVVVVLADAVDVLDVLVVLVDMVVVLVVVFVPA